MQSYPAGSRFHQMLAATFRRHTKCVFDQLEQDHISPGQPRILRALIEKDGQIQKDLACGVDLKAATVGDTLFVMEKAGFIRREPVNGDRRALQVYITEAGRQAFSKSEIAFAEAELKSLAGFSPEEKQAFLTQLKRVAKNLGAEF